MSCPAQYRGPNNHSWVLLVFRVVRWLLQGFTGCLHNFQLSVGVYYWYHSLVRDCKGILRLFIQFPAFPRQVGAEHFGVPIRSFSAFGLGVRVLVQMAFCSGPQGQVVKDLSLGCGLCSCVQGF